jgi:hypothetical protein
VHTDRNGGETGLTVQGGVIDDGEGFASSPDQFEQFASRLVPARSDLQNFRSSMTKAHGSGQAMRNEKQGGRVCRPSAF